MRRPVALGTRGRASAAPPCSVDERRCATLHLVISHRVIADGAMPIDLDADGVGLDHLVFEGTRLTDPKLSATRRALG